MSQRKIISAEHHGDDLVITAQLGDGTPGEDGMILDPAWLHQAAVDWMMTSPMIRMGSSLRSAAGYGLETWQDGDITMIRARVVGPAVTLVTSGVIRDMTLGISRPVVTRADPASASVITAGRLSSVGLDDSPEQAEQENP